MTQQEIFDALLSLRNDAIRGDDELDEYFDCILGDVARCLNLSPEQVAVIGGQDEPPVAVAPMPDPEIVLDPSQFEITDGYIGSFGKTYKPATAETLADAIAQAATHNSTTEADIVERLTAGGPVNWCYSANFYYDHSQGTIRQKRNARPVLLVKCDCGHSVPVAQRLSASLGSSCPDCYDRMSN